MNSQEFENSIKELCQNITILNCDDIKGKDIPIKCKDITFEDLEIKGEICRLPLPKGQEGFDMLVLTVTPLDGERPNHFFHSSTVHIEKDYRIESLEELYDFIEAKFVAVKDQDKWYLFYSENQPEHFLLFSIVKSKIKENKTDEEVIGKIESLKGPIPPYDELTESTLTMSLIESENFIYVCTNQVSSVEDLNIIQHQAPRKRKRELKETV